MLWILLDIWWIQDCDRQGNNPDPDHLKDPETKELEEVVPLIVKSIVFPSLENTEEEKSWELEASDHDREGGNNLSCIVLAAECKSDDS